MSGKNENLTQLEQRLSLLVSMPTVSTDLKACRRALERIVDECQGLGLFVHKYDGPHPSMVATTRKTKSPKIMLVAHLDVVPPSFDGHYELKISGNKITGRGTYDMKHAVAVFLEFLHEYADKLNDYDIGIMITTDEELGGYNGVNRLLNQEGWRTEVAYVPDSSSGMRLEAKAKGILQVELDTTGRDAHTSKPWDGDNALTRLMDYLAILQKKYPNKDKSAATLSISFLQGGDVTNQIPDKALARIDIRSFSKSELAEIDSMIMSDSKKRGINYKVQVTGDPLVLDKQNKFVSLFWESFDKHAGRKRDYADCPGASDGRWFAKHGIPCIIIAPDGGDFHGPDEWISRSDLKVFYDMTVDYINRVHGFNGGNPAPKPAKRSLLRRVLQGVSSR